MLANPRVALLLTSLALFACSPGAPASSSRVDRLSAQIAPMQPDPAVAAFLAEEAARAGVRSVGFLPAPVVKPGQMVIRVNYGVTSDDGRIRVANTAAGRSVVNLTHEIAHAARFGGACGGHNNRWLNAYLEIAERFEERFPGARWSGQRPTDRVLRNKARYGIGTRCP